MTSGSANMIPADKGCWVIKLGGSVIFSDALSGWVRVLNAVRHPLVIVPGGGPFAETVRVLQHRFSYDDQTAHRLALLAMEQSAHLLASLSQKFCLVADLVSMGEAWGKNLVPVWAPCAMVCHDDSIEASWDVTSDSLAAWLAGRLCAHRLYLVKSLSLGRGQASVEQLQSAGLVDKAFPAMLNVAGCQASILGPRDVQTIRVQMEQGEVPDGLFDKALGTVICSKTDKEPLPGIAAETEKEFE